MNKLLYQVRQFFKNKRPVPGTKSAGSAASDISGRLKSRERHLVGEEMYEQRRLYERWVAKDGWTLETEAVPLVLGYDPEIPEALDEEYKKSARVLIEHARHCITHHLSLNAVNSEDPPEQWKVRPTEFYCWVSVSRVQMPESLVNLMEFVIHTVKGEKDRVFQVTSDVTGPAQEATGREFDLQRERILGAALAVLAEFPDQCRNSKGRISVPAITELIQQHHEVWFPDEEKMMSPTTMQDLINKWIKTLKPVIHG